MYACVAAAICAFICILQNHQVVFSRTKDSNDSKNALYEHLLYHIVIDNI